MERKMQLYSELYPLSHYLSFVLVFCLVRRWVTKYHQETWWQKPNGSYVRPQAAFPCLNGCKDTKYFATTSSKSFWRWRKMPKFAVVSMMIIQVWLMQLQCMLVQVPIAFMLPCEQLEEPIAWTTPKQRPCSPWLLKHQRKPSYWRITMVHHWLCFQALSLCAMLNVNYFWLT